MKQIICPKIAFPDLWNETSPSYLQPTLPSTFHCPIWAKGIRYKPIMDDFIQITADFVIPECFNTIFWKVHFCLPGLVDMAGVPSWMVVGVDTSIVVGCNDTTGREGGVSRHRGWLMASRVCGGAALVKVVGRRFDTTPPFWMNFLSVMWTCYIENKRYLLAVIV